MRFSYDWIREYVDTDTPAAEAAAALTAAGLAVEAQERSGDDVIFDVDVTTNRPDCMCHFGLARELATLLERRLELPRATPPTAGRSVSDAARVEVADQVGCPRYVARLVEGVQVGPSPPWLVDRLAAIGQRPINNIVDVTNFVLWELGQPIHAFDLDRLSDSTIVVRRALPGEQLATLDGERRELDPEVLVIADAERAVALAGIMGGLESEVTEGTTNVLIESAHFDPIRVRLGARRLGLHTDASHRFERGADPEICRFAADRVAALIHEVAGGRVLGDAIDVRNLDIDWRLQGRLEQARLERFAGVEIASDRIESWLAGLGFGLEVESAGVWRVGVPSWRYYDLRPDPEQAATSPPGEIFEADLFEEVLRMHGFDEIPATLPEVGGPDEGSSESYWRREEIRRHLAACGYCEAVTFAFHDEPAERSSPALERAGEPLRLANPLSELYTVMRRSLLPGLVSAADFNRRRGARAVRLFEIAHVFPGEDGPELEVLAMVAGGSLGSLWNRDADYDLFDLKGAIESLGRSWGIELEFRQARPPGFVDGSASEIVAAGRSGSVVGLLGQLERHESAVPLFAAELRTAVFDRRAPLVVSLPSRYPAVEVDVTLSHSREIPWSEVAGEIESANMADLVSFWLKDRYTGEGVPPGAVNTTISFLYNAMDRSLTQEEVNQRLDGLRQRLEERFGWRGSI